MTASRPARGRARVVLAAASLALAACEPAAKTGEGATTASASTKGTPPPTASASPPQANASPPTTAAPSAPDAPSSTVRWVMAPADAELLSLVRTERLRAKAEDRVLVVYVGASWCPPCKRFKEEIASHRLDASLARVTFLAFDADADAERLASAGYRFDFVPFVALPGPDGHPSASVAAKGRGGGAWRELLGSLEAWQR